jgi:Fur family transcriptional regulator, ferric uptake regulator
MRHGNPWIRQRMVEEGLRITAARKIIVDILSKSSQHLSAEDIFFMVRGINPSVGFATVYRTLDLLTNMGIVQKFGFGDGRARYELMGGQNKESHHHHLVCTKCREIINYTDFIEEEKELVEKTEEALARRHHFEIKNHIIHFYGLCANCQGGG